MKKALSFSHRLAAAIFAATALVAVALPARAWDPSAYADASRLAEGSWVKIAVTSNGIHFIPAAKLAEWGFSDPSRVEVFGYGGKRLNEQLLLADYADDLPVVQSVHTSAGIYFWARGPLHWSEPDDDGNFHHRINPYTLRGYYFLRALPEGHPDARPSIPVEGLSQEWASDFATTVRQPLWHEVDKVSPGESGHLLLGEDFRINPSQTFTFDMPGRVESEPVDVRVSFFTNVQAAMPLLRISANSGAAQDNRLTRTTSSSYGDTTLVFNTFNGVAGNRLQLSMQFSSSATVLMANLNYIDVNYTRRLSLDGIASLEFGTSQQALELAGTTPQTRIWDITNPLAITAMATSGAPTSGSVRWVSEYAGPRRYIAWKESDSYPCPEYVEAVANQNIHGAPTPDMVIFTPAVFMSQAERVANIHRSEPDNLRVLVLDQQTVFNEFGSGMPDVGALRRCLKMFYDRGTDDEGHTLAYAMMMGRPSFDHRRLTDFMINNGWETVPQWQTDNGSDDSYSFGMDDHTVFLEDGSGLLLGNERLSIAVGRMPVRNTTEAKEAVDKLISYTSKSPQGDWKNRMVLLADDQDNGIHLEQTEAAVSDMMATDDGNRWLYRKVYLDAYPRINGVCEGARTDMYKWLNEGAAWWVYIGHASIDTWSGEGVMTRTDIRENQYFSRLPMIYAATCSFARWDSSYDSGMEMMWRNSSGGTIAAICPTRPVYISSNGVFTRQWAAAVHERDDQGRFLAIGEILRRAKNKGRNDTNRLRFAMVGDPALRVPTPSSQVVLTEVDGQAVSPDDMPVIASHSMPVLSGFVAGDDGEPDTSFNGSLYLSIYDAEYSVTTLGRGDESDPGKKCVFEQQGTKLYTGRTKVTDGRWEITVAMPTEIAWNYRPAAVNMYAVTADSRREAMGLSREIYVYGYDDEATHDTEKPVIHAAYLNHEKFKNGDSVNEDPMLFAFVSDNVGINLSQAGVGHSLYVKVDNQKGYTDVSDYYTPAADGSPSGVVKYPVPTLKAGHHTLDLRVWDTSHNYAETQLEFYVIPGLAPDIFDVWTDSGAASLEAHFYISHDRPDAILDVTVTVYDLMGRPLWSGSHKGRSDEFVSAPLTWNLCDQAGNRVPRGIYVFKADLTADGEHSSSKAKRMAVAGQ